ncbi:MAG: DUF2970 domain-containing protein [Methylococcales bacterium]|nr:DUF2970 domain-containing protein [Methylococcales bacterium]
MSKLKLLQVFKSVLAAGIGIQSNKNRKADFEHGSLTSFIIVGLLTTIAFILIISLVVSTVIS